MTMITKMHGYKLHCSRVVSTEDAERLVSAISSAGFSAASSKALKATDPSAPIRDITEKQSDVLGGRGLTVQVALGDGTPVIIKHYRRGGVLRFLVDRRYLRTATPRPKREFDMLQKVRSCGVSAPEPIAWIQQGSFVYQGWLASVQLPNVISLAELSLTNIDDAVAILPRVAVEVEKLIREGVFHVDLHPGNVLITSNGGVAIIDFDKSHIYSGPKNKLRDLYICRWRRAVLKHKLSHRLVEGMCGGLLKRY